MLVWKKILWLRERVYEQKKWIDRCGGSLTGYIENYGDPGIPPLKDGKPHILTVPANKQHFIENSHVRVPGTDDQFYANHYGDGGTKIYEADFNRLKSWYTELSELQIHNCAARQKADEMEKKGVKVRE
jgi:hypothetical protein